MSIEVWFGRWPDDYSSQQFIVDLFKYLKPMEEHFVLLANFHAGGSNEIDFGVIKQNGFFIIEHKHYQNKVLGSQEGVWKSYDREGNEIIVKPAKPNPYKQLKYNYWHFKDWVEKTSDEISAGIPRTAPIDPGAMRSYIVFSPDLHPESQIDIGRGPVEIMGRPQFLLALSAYSSRGLDLSVQEMGRIPRLLQLEEWKPPEHAETQQPGGQWKPQPFAALVARGHSASVPVFKLDVLGKELITIGREGDNDLVISDQTVSRHHASIRRDMTSGKPIYVVEDQGSTSGTFVSFAGELGKENQLHPKLPNALKNNSIVRFGNTSFTFLEQKADS